MKKTIYSLRLTALTLLVALGLNSCSSWLILYPEGETLLEDFWKSGSDVESVVASCYRSMQDDAFMSRVIQWGEIRSDNVVAGEKVTTDQQNIFDMNIQSNNTLSDWASFYVVINFCNTVLHFAPTVLQEDMNFSISEMRALCAEAQAIRALCYFYLVRTFGDVPLRMEPTIDDTEGFDIPKTDGKIVLDSMIVSLREAIPNARTSFGSNNTSYNLGRFTSQSIRALLADICLWQGYYQECSDVCDEFLAYNESLGEASKQKLIEDPEMWIRIFGVEASYDRCFQEAIFALQFTTNGKENGSVASLYGDSKNFAQLSTDVGLSMYMAGNLFRMTDERLPLSVTSSNSGRSGMQAKNKSLADPAKYACNDVYESAAEPGVYNYSFRSEKYVSWIFYRLSDIYLMKAEAEVELAASENDPRLNTAMYFINKTYMRGNYTLNPLYDTLRVRDYQSKEQMRELVLDERQREFLFEGKRWFDLVRHCRKEGNTMYLRTKVGEKYNALALNKLQDMNSIYMPISESEMTSNKSMVQNPFYEITSTSEKDY